jgi:hypothetical protein
MSAKLFPLTLTFSQREREQQSDLAVGHRNRPANPVAKISERLNSILLLPLGEGRDEGNENLISKSGSKGNL